MRVLVLYIPSILWGIESAEGGFALQDAWPGLAWALHSEKVGAPHQLAQPTDGMTPCQAEGDGFQGPDCRSSAAAALTYTAAMIATSPSRSTCQAQTLQ